jgi:hypothetical protein|tara:strand:+ start:2222 stop:2809 length:588 start_codon:yes stop_codon:yes gene_type:complete
MPNVTNVKSKQILFGTDTDAISAAGTATTLVLLNSGPWVNAQTVTITSSADNSGITFTVVGKNADGDAATSAATTGPDSTTVDVAGTWSEVTSITASGSITTNISAGVKEGASTGTIFAGRTRIRGMYGVAGGGAGRVFIKNSSATTGPNRLIVDVDSGEDIDPYIPDNGILCEDGAYFAYDGTAVVGLSIQFDG